LEVLEPSLLRLTDQGQKLVEGYLSQGMKHSNTASGSLGLITANILKPKLFK